MSKRLKTKSLNFFDDEIKFIEYDSKGKKIIHVFEHVHRTYNPYLLDYENPRQINDIMIHIERIQEVYKKLYGGDDFEDKTRDRS